MPWICRLLAWAVPVRVPCVSSLCSNSVGHIGASSMQVVVAGFEESRCRNLANAMDLHADALTWLDFETFTRCLDEEPWDDSATRVFWFFQAPSVALMETTRTAEMRAVRILEQWWKRNRAVLDLHRRHGMPLRL